jgi:uncharacterized membrane-anchored protein YhcB (DUF1043 family)
MTESIVYIIISAIVGTIIGFSLAYFTFRNKDKGRLEDQLTRTRRDLANQKRMLTDFFNSSNALFEQLENSYQAYAHHMSEQSKKIAPQLGNIYETSTHPSHYKNPMKENISSDSNFNNNIASSESESEPIPEASVNSSEEKINTP